MNGAIQSKIQRIEENIKKLNELYEMDQKEFTDDFRNVEAAKHLLQTSIEAMIDIANHIIAQKKFRKPDTSAEAFEILAENNLIADDSRDKYILMTKFRNKVVHLYTKVDDQEIFKIMQNNLSDYKKFIREILKII